MTSITQAGTPGSQQERNGHEAPTFVIENDPAPLYLDQDGAARVTGTKVLLEIVVGAFARGDTPAEIVESYTTLGLADVYAVVAYYLRHREAIETYIERCDKEAQEIRRTIETYQNSAEFLDGLKAQRATRGS